MRELLKKLKIRRAKFEINVSENGQFYFVMKAGNGEVIAVSEQYTSKQGCKRGISSVKRGATLAKTVDNTV